MATAPVVATMKNTSPTRRAATSNANGVAPPQALAAASRMILVASTTKQAANRRLGFGHGRIYPAGQAWSMDQ